MTIGGSHQHDISDIVQLKDQLDTQTKTIQDLTERIRKVEATLATSTGPTVTGPTGVTGTTTTTWKPAFPGDTKPGTLRWGCSYQGNGDPSSIETAAGISLGVRRTFWRLDQASSIVTTCKADIAKGRVPWISIKLGTTWQAAATGSVDSQLKTLFTGLGSVGGPVWFTAHHEPEGGNGTAYPDDGQGTEQYWRAMQKRVREVLNGTGVKNVAFAPILMSWTFDPRSKRNVADWWVDGVWDFFGIDHYASSEDAPGMIDLSGWKNASAFCKAKNIKIGIAEWGNRGTDAQAALEMEQWYKELISVGAVGASYFNTTLNGGIPLAGEPLNKFYSLLKAPTSVRL